jgi:hypothetical protein
MKFHRILALYLLLPFSLPSHAGIYDLPIARGATWLAAQQNGDGSWGASPGLQPVFTSAAVRALCVAYKRQSAFFAGLTWLESHKLTNVDVVSRRVGALASHGNDLGYALTYLQSAQARAGANYVGWGLSPVYSSSAIDTALALMAYADLGSNIQIQPALNFLKASQRTGVNNNGWAIDSATSSDPAVTALVIQALARYTAVDATLSAAISNGLNTLSTLVGAPAPPVIQALAAQAALDAGNSPLATTFLTRLTASQATDGNWNADPYITALATRAIATAANAAALATAVSVPDQALRRAINNALGRNAMDNLNRGELLQLTSLSAIGAGISSLTGLEWAINLSSVNFNNNNLLNITPLSGLPQLTSTSWIGNPGNPGTAQVPALPPLGQLLMALGLLGIMAYFRRSSASYGV